MRNVSSGPSPCLPRAPCRSLRRVAKLVEVPSIDAVPWEHLRYGHYQAIKGKLLASRRDPDDPNSGLSPGTINLTLTHLRGIARQVWSLGYMTAEEWECVKEIKPTKGQRLPAGRDARSGELAALLDACVGDPSPAGVRDAAIIALLYSTGMRRAKLVGLEREDYDSSSGTLKVRHGKGRKERLVYAAGGAHAALADWLVVRGDRSGARSQARSALITPRPAPHLCGYVYELQLRERRRLA